MPHGQKMQHHFHKLPIETKESHTIRSCGRVLSSFLFLVVLRTRGWTALPSGASPTSVLSAFCIRCRFGISGSTSRRCGSSLRTILASSSVILTSRTIRIASGSWSASFFSSLLALFVKSSQAVLTNYIAPLAVQIPTRNGDILRVHSSPSIPSCLPVKPAQDQLPEHRGEANKRAS